MKYDFCTTLSCMCFSFPGYFSGYLQAPLLLMISRHRSKVASPKASLAGSPVGERGGGGGRCMTHLPAQRKLLLIIELSNISLHHVFIKNASIFTLDSVFNYVKKIKKKRGFPLP